MFRALVLLLVVLIISMIVCVSIVNKKLIKNRSHVVHLINMAIFTAACYTVFILVPSGYDTLATFMSGLYFLSTDWLVIYLMFFVAAYTHIQPPSKLPRRIIGILAGVDSVSFLINTFTHHMYELEAGSSDQSGIFYWNIQLQPLHAVHRIFVYSIVLYSLCILIYRLIKAPVMFKNKYSSILFQTLAVVGLNVFCSIKNAKFDYSVILYASLAISICYFALYALPKKVFEKICSTVVEDSVIGMFAYDNDGKCVGVNEMAKDLFAGDDEIEVIAERYLADWLQEHKDSSLNVIGEERSVIKNGEKKYIYVTYQKYLDEKGRKLGCCFQFEDRTEVVKNFKEEKYRATHDMLTGLLNREAFEMEVKKILAKAEEPYCMVCSNIQDFKMINELYGPDVGDKLLLTQADIIRSEEEEASVSARMYADKFCTLMPRRSFNEKMFTENMSKVLDLGEDSPFKPHFYLGVYDITDINEPVWTMYDKAILAINTIRGNYGKYVAYYKEELLERILEEREVLGGFDKALAEGQFHMFLQPQIANNGTIVGAEALVRWIHPDKGLVNPGLFIPTLEKAGLIHKLDVYMWECAAKKLEEWKKQGREDLSISVNISTKDFFYLDIPKTFHSLAQKYDFNIEKLKLEITESALIENVLAIMKILDELHALGYDIEIDDFGSGYSSLGMLKDINADILKIDMIFLQETKNIMRSNTILKNIISMSKELGMPIIMEGVETKEQVDFLRNVGCDMFQGYYFAKPMNVENFEQAYC